MNLALDESQQILVQTFSDLLARECRSGDVRECEALGHSPKLWSRYVELGAMAMGMPEASGGLGLGLLELGLVAGCSGRALAPVPFSEVAAAGRIVAALAAEDALAARIAAGEVVLSLAPIRTQAIAGTSASAGEAILVPAGAVVDGVLALEGEDLVLYETVAGQRPPRVVEVGSGAHAFWTLGAAEGRGRRVLAQGETAVAAYALGLAEWKLLTAFALVGLARAALEQGAQYAKERVQFGVPIGSFQAIAHPLADCATRVDGAELLCWEAAWARDAEPDRFDVLASMAFVWAGQTAQRTASVSLHTHGGYGFSLEYDIQLAYRRAFAWPLAAGGTREERARVAASMLGRTRAAESIARAAARWTRSEPSGLDFRLGAQADRVRDEIRAFLRREFSAEDAERERREGGGHDWPLYRKLAADGWVSAGWPKAIGGGGRSPYEILALYWELSKAGFPWFGLMNNGFIGHTLMALGTEAQKRELVPRIAQGEILVALGYSEPGAGSDVAAARTQARRDGEDWILDGEKMWTTTAHEAQYVFTLTRTSQQDRPHRGLTMFLVPTDAPGVEIRPVHTLGGERTNSFSLRSVRVPDGARVGEVDQGWAVVRFALGLEQAMGYADLQERFLEEALVWAQTAGADGARPCDDSRVREQLAQSAIHAEVARLLRHRSTWLAAEERPLGAKGAMTKSFSAATYLEDTQAWVELAGPLALLGAEEPRRIAGGIFEEVFRQTPVNTIYGGTVEILRSLVAEIELGLPKSR